MHIDQALVAGPWLHGKQRLGQALTDRVKVTHLLRRETGRYHHHIHIVRTHAGLMEAPDIENPLGRTQVLLIGCGQIVIRRVARRAQQRHPRRELRQRARTCKFQKVAPIDTAAAPRTTRTRRTIILSIVHGFILHSVG